MLIVSAVVLLLCNTSAVAAPALMVGATTVPLNVGLALGASNASAVVARLVSTNTAAVTKAVLPIWVVFVPGAAVGAVAVLLALKVVKDPAAGATPPIAGGEAR